MRLLKRRRRQRDCCVMTLSTALDEENQGQATTDRQRHRPSAIRRFVPTIAGSLARVNIEFSYRVAGPSPRAVVAMNTNHHRQSVTARRAAECRAVPVTTLTGV